MYCTVVAVDMYNTYMYQISDMYSYGIFCQLDYHDSDNFHFLCFEGIQGHQINKTGGDTQSECVRQ